MAYVGSKNPGGKLPGWGWAPGLRGYVNSKVPGGPLPGWGWSPNLRGIGSGLRKIVVGNLGCACKEKNLSGLGQDDDTVSSVAIPTDPSIYTLPGYGTVLPAGVGYGPSPSGGVATYPAGSSSFDVSYATPSDLTSVGGSSYSAAQIASLLGTGLTTTASPSSSSSTALWLIGGLAAFVVILEVSGKRR